MHMRSLLASFAVSGLIVTGAAAADLVPMQPAPAYNPAAFSFEGFYLGGQGGGIVGNSGGGSVGVVAGANFDVGSAVLAGGEFQGDWLFGNGSSATYDFYALGRLGVEVTDSFLAYAEAGPGWSSNGSGYAFGGGGEYALTDAMSVKGEALGTGQWGSGASAAKIQAGLLFHLQ